MRHLAENLLHASSLERSTIPLLIVSIRDVAEALTFSIWAKYSVGRPFDVCRVSVEVLEHHNVLIVGSKRHVLLRSRFSASVRAISCCLLRPLSLKVSVRELARQQIVHCVGTFGAK